MTRPPTPSPAATPADPFPPPYRTTAADAALAGLPAHVLLSEHSARVGRYLYHSDKPHCLPEEIGYELQLDPQDLTDALAELGRHGYIVGVPVGITAGYTIHPEYRHMIESAATPGSYRDMIKKLLAAGADRIGVADLIPVPRLTGIHSARVYQYLYTSDGPRTHQEIADALGTRNVDLALDELTERGYVQTTTDQPAKYLILPEFRRMIDGLLSVVPPDAGAATADAEPTPMPHPQDLARGFAARNLLDAYDQLRACNFRSSANHETWTGRFQDFDRRRAAFQLAIRALHSYGENVSDDPHDFIPRCDAIIDGTATNNGLRLRYPTPGRGQPCPVCTGQIDGPHHPECGYFGPLGLSGRAVVDRIAAFADRARASELDALADAVDAWVEAKLS